MRRRFDLESWTTRCPFYRYTYRTHTLKSLWSICVKITGITGFRIKFYGPDVCVPNAEEWADPDLIGIAMDIGVFLIGTPKKDQGCPCHRHHGTA